MPSSRVPSLDDLIGLLPESEQRCMKLDGEAVSVGRRTVSITDCLTPERKTELACSIDAERYILSGWSALWAAGLCSEPVRHDVVLRPGVRPRGHAEDELIVHDLSLRDGDLIDYGARGARLNPIRALCDVLRFDDAEDEYLVRLVTPILGALNITTEHVRASITMEKTLPYRKRAVRRLALIDAIDVIDAVNATHGVENALEVARVPGLKHKPAEGQTL